MEQPFIKKFEVRWNDLDANMHVANSTYQNYMNQTRLDFFNSHGFGFKEYKDLNIGPVLFYDHIYYFDEILPGSDVYVSFQMKGKSADHRFYEFQHCFYDKEGKQKALAEVMITFINLDTRKIQAIPQKYVDILVEHIKPTEDFKVLSKEDTRRFNKFPINRPEWFQGIE